MRAAAEVRVPVGAPDALLRGNRIRRRVRRIVAIASVPLVLAAFVVSAKLVSMYGFAHRAATSYAEGDYAATVRAGERQGWLNRFTPFLAPFNEGVGWADAGELDAARAAFEESLTLAHALEECPVRINLAIVWERTGDAAQRDGDPTAAREAWQEGLRVVQDAPDDCRDPGGGGDGGDSGEGGEGGALGDRQQQLEDKLADSPPQQGEESPEPEPDSSELDEIKERLEEGARDRDDHERDAQGGGSASQPGVERPW